MNNQETRLTTEWASSEFEGLRSDLFDDMLDLMFVSQGGSKVGGVRDF